MDPRRHELLRRQRRDALHELAMLDAGEMWHTLSEDDCRGMLIQILDDIEWELEGGDDWRPDDE